jgi:DNA invertase Pin-like site-specific DNA recombinase
MNENYCRQVSQKVRQVRRKGAESGKFMGNYAPYGYDKCPTDKYKLIVDEVAARVVQRIFDEFLKGTSARQIGERLNMDGIPCPQAHRYDRLGKPNSNKSKTWCSSTVTSTLDNQVYLGHLISGKREVVSFKTKQRRTVAPEDWIIVHNTHEAIISQEVWDKAQALRKRELRTRKVKDSSKPPIFSGLVFCKDCNAQLAATFQGREGSQKRVYRCGTYNNHGKSVCASHSIKEDVLEAVVLSEIHQYAVLATADRESLTQKVLAGLMAETNQNKVSAKKELQAVRKKVDSIKARIKSVYLDKMNGKIDESIAFQLLADFDSEQRALQAKIPDLETKADEERSHAEDTNQWLELISDYLDIKCLDPILAKALIDRIIVSDKYVVDEVSHKDIEIFYKFVGNITAIIPATKDAA